MGVLAEGGEHFLQSIQRAAGKNQGLLRIAQWNAGIQLESADDHNLPIVILTIRGRATRHAGIGGLTNHDAVRRDAGLEHVPEIKE